MTINQFRKFCLKARDNKHELYDVTPIDEYFQKLRCRFCGITVITGHIHPDRQTEFDAIIQAELNNTEVINDR